MTDTQSQRIYDIICSNDRREELAERIAVLEDENTKLRELVRALDWCTENFDLPNKCDICLLGESSKVECECEVRMRELGIEAES